MLSDVGIENSSTHNPSSELLKELWGHGVNSVSGRTSVKRYFDANIHLNNSYSVIAIGKAATDMMLGAIDVLGCHLQSGLVLTKTNHVTDELLQYKHISHYESSHPVPDERSLHSGELLLQYISNIPLDHQVLVLVSGGASSLVEVLANGCTLDDLQKMNSWALQSGLNINEINYMRQKVSLIKGGKLCQYFNQAEVLCLYISDVPGDNIHVIGSGLLCLNQKISELISTSARQKIDCFVEEVSSVPPLEQSNMACASQFIHHIVANNDIAKQSVQRYASNIGYSTRIINRSIDTDYRDVATMVAEELRRAPPGIYIWGGEPTVELPDSPGDGGRNQALALLLSLKIKEVSNITTLVAGTDGTDGPTDAAGAVVHGKTYQQALCANFEPEKLLDEANAYPCLKAIGSLYCPGPTGTNVMDLIIAKVS